MNQADVTFTGHICISHYNCGINPCSNASVMALVLAGKEYSLYAEWQGFLLLLRPQYPLLLV